MAKDKYSDDHTIKIVGGTQTLTVEDNLNVVGDADIGGDLNVVGSLTAGSVSTTSGDLEINGDLVINGSVTSDEYLYDGTKDIISWIPIEAINDAKLFSSVPNTIELERTGGAGVGVANYAGLYVSFSVATAWDMLIPLDPWLKNNATLKNIYLYMSTGIVIPTGDYTLDWELLEVEKIGNSPIYIVAGPTTEPIIGSVLDFRSRQALNTAYGPLDIDGDLSSKSYQLKISQTDAGLSVAIKIYAIGLEMTVPSVDVAIGIY